MNCGDYEIKRKTCRACQKTLTTTQFHRHKRSKDGFSTRCFKCIAQRESQKEVEAFQQAVEAKSNEFYERFVMELK